MNRRTFLGTCAVAGALPLATLAAASAKSHKLRILCIGGHPDDPETGCGGTLARFATAGHDLTVVYLTRGDAGIPGKSLEETAAIRTKEAEAGCAILKVRPIFFRDGLERFQIDGQTQAGTEAMKGMHAIVAREDPHILLAHWPLDSHRDHQIASLLAVRAWMDTDRRASLYFFEVCAGEQTIGFTPTDYVDITEVQEVKRKAEACHPSQNLDKIYVDHHGPMERFRGREIGVAAAEAFVRLAPPRNSALLPEVIKAGFQDR